MFRTRIYTRERHWSRTPVPGPAGRGISPQPGGNDRGSQHLRPADEAASPIEIRRKSFKGERLTPAEAVDRMELVGHDFYLYIDSETGAPAAAYRRKGWSYGIITLDNE